jgi:hypothetical protein
MGLTAKQEMFATEYVKGDDKSQAYRIAYNTSKMSDKQVWEESSKLSRNPKVAQRIAELKGVAADIAAKHFEIDSKELLSHLNILRQSSIDQYVNFVEIEQKALNPETDELEVVGSELVMQFKPFDQLTKEQLMCIESIKDTRNGIELKLHGKDWTIDKIAKHIGFYEKDNNQRKTELTVEVSSSEAKEINKALEDGY